ncbi:rod shape-determining protein MreD [Oceanobacillus bengalensis]|uniref:Rod shape-determining protein MreD n=1 Tax=Oceanobacillus bengalensis TaxID=1435466 RepID=A0A494Z5X2_9BACI|nr:rod shape-determining protein MreD [Oceanobacillus bengalensis]RKQ17940.1 rod shape-determining protein MreD [Oceanobacillus bengalensis]
MKRVYIPLFLFLLLILEGVATDFLPSDIVMGELLIVPHWLLVGLVFITLYYDRENTYYSVMYAIIFGLLVDVVYTGILGVYMFSYAAVVYLIHVLKKLLHVNLFVLLLMGIVGVGMSDLLIYISYTIVGIIDMFWKDYLFYRLLPTIGLNLVFFIILYPILMKRLKRWGSETNWK